VRALIVEKPVFQKPERAFLQLNKIPGIGAVTINKLIKVAEENGYL